MENKNLPAEIRVSNQSELDTIPLDYSGIIKISGGTFDNPIQVTKKYDNDVEVIRNACVHAHNDVKLSAWSNAHVTAFDNVYIKAFSDTTIIAHGFSEVEAFERTNLRADGNSKITLYDDVYLDSASVGVTLIDNRNKKPVLTQAENEASFERQNGLALSEKKLIIGESYRLNPKENTEYKVLGIDGEQALLRRNQGRGNNYIQDPTPYVIATLPEIDKNGYISWSSGSYRTEIPIDFNLPIYLESFEYSVENNEVEIYHASGDINRACAKAIDTAIHDSEHERYFYNFNEALKTVTEQFGSERVNAVLANTIKHYEYDGRISQKNKDWAREIETPQDKYLLLHTHLAVLDGFANKARAIPIEKKLNLSLIEEPYQLDGYEGGFIADAVDSKGNTFTLEWRYTKEWEESQNVVNAYYETDYNGTDEYVDRHFAIKNGEEFVSQKSLISYDDVEKCKAFLSDNKNACEWENTEKIWVSHVNGIYDDEKYADYKISIKNFNEFDLFKKPNPVVSPEQNKYELGYGYLGNGLTVWNKLEERNGDYRTVAHIETDRSVKFYDKNMPESIKENIIKVAQTAKMYLSNTNQNKITKEEKTMDYTAKVTKIENESNVKGLATVEINGFVSVNSVKIVEGENGLFVSMPKFKDSKGEYKNLVFTVKEGVMDEISKAVLNEYHYSKQEQAETNEQCLCQ